MQSRYRALEKKHGTMQEFEAAVWRAEANLMITTEEAIAAVGKYRGELADARLADMEAARPTAAKGAQA